LKLKEGRSHIEKKGRKRKQKKKNKTKQNKKKSYQIFWSLQNEVRNTKYVPTTHYLQNSYC